MKINGNEIRVGNVIQHQNSLWVAVKTSHVKPGKGGAFAQVEMKNLINGSKLNERFRSSETVERVRLDQKDYQYLYADGEQLTFMDQENFEQVQIEADLLGERVHFLQDGMKVTVESFEGRAIGVKLPQHVTLSIKETEPTVKGQTASSSYKPAVLSNGVRCMVPPFCGVGDNIIVDTEEVTYLRRAD